MKWRNGNDLPKENGKYVCRKKPVSNAEIYVDEVFFNEGKFQTAHTITEWLDESQSLQPSTAEGGKTFEETIHDIREGMIVGRTDKEIATQFAYLDQFPNLTQSSPELFTREQMKQLIYFVGNDFGYDLNYERAERILADYLNSLNNKQQ